MLTDGVTVSSGYWRVWGRDASGLSLVPLIFGIALVFFNGRSIPGWLLLSAGLITIVSGILLNLHFYVQPASMFNTIVRLALLAGGASA